LVKIQVPHLIVNYLCLNVWLIGGLTLFYLLMTMIGIRLILIMSLMAYQHLRLRAAMSQSWQMTSKLRWLKFLIQIVLMTIIVGSITVVYYLMITFSRLFWIYYPGNYL